MPKKKVIKLKKGKKKSAPKKSVQAKKKPIQAKAKQKSPAKTPAKDIVIPQAVKPEPKNKLVLEYIVHSSPKLLYDFLTSPSGLSEWFADDVNINGNVYTFIWDGAKQEANLIELKEEKYIRLHWTDRPADTYFEFRIEKNELTEELSLIITDFAESEEDKYSLEVLWQGQVQRLMKVIGSKA
jgi:uncharacterized protein YndB with AHSA1/START domain